MVEFRKRSGATETLRKAGVIGDPETVAEATIATVPVAALAKTPEISASADCQPPTLNLQPATFESRSSLPIHL